MQIRTRAIVFNTLDFSDSSLICTVFCERGGRVSLLAKGAKNPKSKFFGRFEPGSRVEVVFSSKPGRQLQLVTDVFTAAKMPNLWERPDLGALVYNTIELSGQFIQDHLDDVEKFHFLWTFLEWAGIPENSAGMIHFPYVQTRLCALQGISLSLGTSIHFFNVETGEAGTDESGAFNYALTDWQKSYFDCIKNRKTALIAQIADNKGELQRLIHMLDLYMKHHIEGLKPRRSAAIFEQMDL